MHGKFGGRSRREGRRRARHRVRGALRFATLAVGALALSGCVFYAVDDGPPCGAQASRIGGECVCLADHVGDPYVGCDPVMTFLITDACDDGLDVEWRMHARDRDWVWPDANSVFVTPGLDVDAHQNLGCLTDETICFGAVAGERVWGVGLEGPQGPHSCEDCCFTCGPYEVDLGFLTCN